MFSWFLWTSSGLPLGFIYAGSQPLHNRCNLAKISPLWRKPLGLFRVQKSRDCSRPHVFACSSPVRSYLGVPGPLFDRNTSFFMFQNVPLFSLFALCSSTVLPHFNIFQPLFFVCVLYAFCLPFSLQKTHEKIALPCMVGIGEVCGSTFLQHNPLRGGYTKGQDCSWLFLLFVAAPEVRIVLHFLFSSLAQQRIPLDYSSLESPSRAFFSLPILYRHKGQFVQVHRRTSALLPQQQSRHFNLIALPLVILSSMLSPHPCQHCQLLPAESFKIFLLWRFFLPFSPSLYLSH